MTNENKKSTDRHCKKCRKFCMYKRDTPSQEKPEVKECTCTLKDISHMPYCKLSQPYTPETNDWEEEWEIKLDTPLAYHEERIKSFIRTLLKSEKEKWEKQ